MEIVKLDPPVEDSTIWCEVSGCTHEATHKIRFYEGCDWTYCCDLILELVDEKKED